MIMIDSVMLWLDSWDCLKLNRARCNIGYCVREFWDMYDRESRKNIRLLEVRVGSREFV